MPEKTHSEEIPEYDPEKEKKEIDLEMKAQDEEEDAKDKAHEKELSDDIKTDKFIENQEAQEQSDQHKRILDELKDKKEEDGGEYRE